MADQPSRLSADRLTPAEARILEHLATGEGHGDLLWARPGGWWYGTTRTGGAIGFLLLRKGYISPDLETGQSVYYRINEDGERALAAHRRGEAFYPPLWREMARRQMERSSP